MQMPAENMLPIQSLRQPDVSLNQRRMHHQRSNAELQPQEEISSI